MEKLPLYTVGHGRRPAQEFLLLLQKFHIRYLIDVRSKPYSRFNPQYHKTTLEAFLKANGITYVFMGDELGGRPEDPSCYNVSGKPDYNLMKEKAGFRQGIQRLKAAYDKNVALAIMCSESKPEQCHRSLLIGKILEGEGIPVQHII